MTYLNVEQTINQFVIEFGGKLVGELIPKNTDRPNADYLFYNPDVIAELKCFQKDIFSFEDDSERHDAIHKKWVDMGIFNDYKKMKEMLDTNQYPKECIPDLEKIVTKTIDRALHHANKQIIETKNLLNLPNAKGLLLICNEGNHLLNHAGFMWYIIDILQRKYKDTPIDVFIYFTINLSSEFENDNRDHYIWYPLHKRDDDNILKDFIKKLSNFFLTDFMPRMTGEKTYIIDETDEIKNGKNPILKHKYIDKQKRK